MLRRSGVQAFRFWILLISPALFIASVGESCGQELKVRAHERQTAALPAVILILTEGLTLEDLEDPKRKALFEFVRTGRAAMMSVPVAGKKSDSAAMLALASGSLIPSQHEDDQAFMTRERHPEGDSAALVFRRRSANPVPLAAKVDSAFPYSGQALHLGIASFERRNLHRRFLGSWLGDKNAAVAGNADSQVPHRGAALFGMDLQGLIPEAFIGRETLEHAPAAPFDRTDSPELLAAWAMSRDEADLVVMHLGDMARAESARNQLTEAQFGFSRDYALRGLDRLIASLRSRNRARKLSPKMLLVSTRPPLSTTGGWERLSIAVLGGWGTDERPGLLSSATTRTQGLVSNLDIAPTVLSWLGKPSPPHMSGHTISTANGDLSDLQRIDSLTRVNAQGLVRVFVGLGIAAALVALVGLFSVSMGAGASAAAFLFLSLSNFPLAMLLVTVRTPHDISDLAKDVVVTVLGLAAVQCLIGLAVRRLRPSVPLIRVAVIALAGMTTVAILVDAFVGQPMIKFSLFSSYHTTGIRFYGIGNEYMGVLVGMALLWVFLGEIPLRWAAGLFVVTALALGLPSLGADAGGFVAAIVAFGSAIVILSGRPAGWKAALALTIIGFAGAFGLAFLDRAISGAESSHLGAAIHSAEREGLRALLEIVIGKVKMSAGILLNPYTLVAIVGMTVMGALLAGPLRGSVERVLALHSGLRRGLPSAGWGALAAFLFNDSGAVPAIFILGSFLASAIILLFFESGHRVNPAVSLET